MSIQKFIVNGDEAKIDYEGLENKPFGEESTTVILPETDDTGFEYVSSGNYYESNHTLTSPLVLTVGDIYHVTFDNVEYLCAAWEIEESDPKIIGVGASDPSDFSSYPFAIAISDGSLMAVTNISGSEHIYKIEQASVSTLNPEYLPKYLQFGKERPVTICDGDYSFTDSASLPGLGHEPTVGTTFLVTIDDGDPIEVVSYIEYGRSDEWVALSDTNGASDPEIFSIVLRYDNNTMTLINAESGAHHVKLEEIRSEKMDLKYVPYEKIYDANNGYQEYSIADALNMLCNELSLNHEFVNELPYWL